jgi:predicted aspartyl protease
VPLKEALVRSRYAEFLVFRAVLLLLLASVPVCAASLRIVPGAFWSGKPYVNCTVDGHAHRFFLDTGSAMTFVANSKSFGAYTNVGKIRFVSAAGIVQEMDAIRAASIAVDDVVFSDLKIGRAGFNSAEHTLGIDIVGRQPFALRFRNKPELRLNAPRPELPLTTLELSPEGLLLIPMQISGVELRALWDTGVSVTTVDQEFIAAHPENFKSTKDYVRGTDGAGKTLLAQIFRAKKIKIADGTFEDVRVVAVDLGVLRERDPSVQAVLGFNVIRKANWFFDAKTRLWKIER